MLVTFKLRFEFATDCFGDWTACVKRHPLAGGPDSVHPLNYDPFP